MSTNSPFEDLVSRLTHRLRVDAELQMEVAKELRSHLQDSAADFKAGGMSEAEAVTAATTSLGAADEVAEQLWQANRQRVRLRHAVKWAAGAVLAPTAVIACGTFAWSALVSLVVFVAVFDMVGIKTNPLPGMGWARAMSQRLIDHGAATASADHALLFDSAATMDEQLQNSKELERRHPDDPVFAANLVNRLMWSVSMEIPSRKESVANLTRDLNDAIERGKKIDPDNAFFPRASAWSYLQRSTANPPTEELDLSVLPGFDFEISGRKSRWTWGRLIVNDEKIFEQALVAMQEAASKRFSNSYFPSLLERKRAAMGNERSLLDHVLSLPEQIRGTWQYDLMQSREAEATATQAARLASRGLSAEALRCVTDTRRLTAMTMASARTMTQYLPARSAHVESFAHEAMVYQILNDRANFDRARREFESAWRASWERPDYAQVRRARVRSSGLIDDTLLAADVELSRVDFAPDRKAEYAVLDRLGLSVILLGLVAIVVTAGAAAVAWRFRWKRWPNVILLPPRELMVTLLFAVVLPTTAYFGWTYFTPFGARQFGIANSLSRVLVEYSLLACVMIILLRIRIDQMLRRRIVAIGAVSLHRPAISRGHHWLGVCIAVLALGYLGFWRMTLPVALEQDHGVRNITDYGYPIAIMLILYAGSWAAGLVRSGTVEERVQTTLFPAWLAWLLAAVGVLVMFILITANVSYRDANGALRSVQVALEMIACGVLILLCRNWWRARKRQDGFTASDEPRFSYGLSAAPILALSALLLWFAAGLPLGAVERHAVTAMNGPVAGFNPLHEVDQSFYRQYRDRLQASGG